MRIGARGQVVGLTFIPGFPRSLQDLAVIIRCRGVDLEQIELWIPSARRHAATQRW